SPFPPMSSYDPTTVRNAVEEFTPIRPQKFHGLFPAKDFISELRQKRASYRAIADLLTKHCLPTSKTAIAVFCHEVLGEIVRPRRRPGRKRTSVSSNGQPASATPQPNAIDSDNENSTLKRFHPDAQFLDITSQRELDGIFRSLERANLVVVDCRAASSELFLDYFVEVEASVVLKALGAVLTLVMPVNHELDSVDQVQRLTDQLRIQIWQRKFYAEIESAADLLLPTK